MWQCIRNQGIVAALAGWVAIASSGNAAQAPVADFYRGKTLTIVLGLPPGGGFDLYARRQHD